MCTYLRVTLSQQLNTMELSDDNEHALTYFMELSDDNEHPITYFMELSDDTNCSDSNDVIAYKKLRVFDK